MAMLQTIREDFAYARGIFRILRLVTPMARRKTRTLPVVMEQLGRRYADRVALLSDHETLTYAGLNGRANRYARWALGAGIAKGDVVCLLMNARPEYLVIWLGIARAGGVTALLNTHLTGAALARCINIVSPRHIIVADDLSDAFDSARPHLTGDATIWRHGGETSGADRIDEAVRGLGQEAIPQSERPPLTHEDRCLYIYTSGTTGMPKAANINHYRVLAAMLAFSAVTEATSEDRMYDCLPLYHTVGGVCALGACLMVGGSVFIRERFSARQLWDDVVDRDCTMFQYIGELCRYLVNAPPHPREKLHRIRLCCGNGLRPDVWAQFLTRFKIPRVREFYAATEGNAVMFNFDNTAGAVGRIPGWAKRILPITSVRYDVEHETPVRTERGLCVECLPDEIGEVIAEIAVNALKPGQRFDGYADVGETEKKILRDVFRKGDAWFRTGDLMRRDRRGYYYFVDRIGDTYRWKGENVATSEVAESLASVPGVTEVNVYGVAVPGAEGRAGMVALVAGPGFDLATLRQHVYAEMPPYARPIFLRLQQAIDVTSTFKQRKVGLVREGFDPSETSDLLYFDDRETEKFAPVDAEVYQAIQSGKIRL